ncbi:hypothetical protein BD414DRAFT_431102 [Trametes punicea]|nr:hypothetical protein BD414DRAFT_431102 [Trametes punicea]
MRPRRTTSMGGTAEPPEPGATPLTPPYVTVSASESPPPVHRMSTRIRSDIASVFAHRSPVGDATSLTSIDPTNSREEDRPSPQLHRLSTGSPEPNTEHIPELVHDTQDDHVRRRDSRHSQTRDASDLASILNVSTPPPAVHRISTRIRSDIGSILARHGSVNDAATLAAIDRPPNPSDEEEKVSSPQGHRSSSGSAGALCP